MKIAVLIKQVPVSDQVSVDPETHALIRSSSETMVNPTDLNAIEAALKIKEQTEGTVVVFTMGPPDAEKALREAMARGCDEGCLITDRCFAGADTMATAKVLAKSINTYGKFDLILCGAMSVDGATGQVGAMVAEYLNIPHVSEVQGISYIGDNQYPIETIKKFKNNNYIVSSRIPTVVSVNFGINEPRLSTLKSKRAAKNKPLTIHTNKELNFNTTQVGIQGSPTKVIDSFEPEIKNKAIIFKGTAKELANKLHDLLEKGYE